jgi:transposase
MPAANRLLAMEEGDRSQCERIAPESKAGGGYRQASTMLVLATPGLSNRQIALELGAKEHVVGRVRKEYNRRGLALFLEDRARPGRPRISRNQQSVQKVVGRVCQALS